MLKQEKSTIYTFSTNDGFYHQIKVFDNGLVECYIYHDNIYYPFFMYCYHLSKNRTLKTIIKQVEKDSDKYKDIYRTYIKSSKALHLPF